VTEKYRKQILRKNCVGQKNGLVPIIYQDVPESIRDEAFRDFFKARKSAFESLKMGFITHFSIKAKKRRSFNQGSLAIRRRFYNGCDFAYKTVRDTYQGSWLRKIKSNPPLPVNLPQDCRLVHNKKNQWILYVPVIICEHVEVTINRLGQFECPINYPEKTKENMPSIVAVDPGGRTFMTAYVASVDPDLHGMVQEFGTAKDANALLKLEIEASKLSKISKDRKKNNQKKRRRQKRRAKKLRNKVRHCVDELHRKIAIWLLDNHSAVIIPKLKTKPILMKHTIPKAAKITLKRWGHNRFQRWIQHKAKFYPNCTLIDWVNEAYTTQACGACGNLNKNVGSSETYRCSNLNCKYSLRRDVHGARNILVKFLSEYGEYLPNIND
jgi:transposase